jgi:hypothetical protein
MGRRPTACRTRDAGGARRKPVSTDAMTTDASTTDASTTTHAPTTTDAERPNGVATRELRDLTLEDFSGRSPA